MACTGWAVIEEVDGGFRYVSSGHIKTKPSDPTPYRLWTIQAGLTEVFTTLSDGDGVVMEKTAALQNRTTNRMLHMVQGCALAAAYPSVNTIRELHPSQWRKYLGDGKMKKDQVVGVVSALLGRDTLAHVSVIDEFEAMGIAIAGSSIGKQA